MKLTALPQLERALAKLAAVGGNVEKFMEGQVRENTRLLISSSGKVPGLVQVTPPFHQGGSSAAAKQAGENAILGDVNVVYANPSDLHQIFKSYGTEAQLRQYWYLLKHKPQMLDKWLERNGPSAIQAMQRGWDDGAAHRKRRKNGRVTGYKPTVILKAGEERKKKKYIKMRQKRVGMLASSIPAAYSGKYGPLRGVPSWVARHKVPWGQVKEIKVSGGLKVRLTLLAPFALKDMQRRFSYVLDYRYRAMRRSLPYAMRAEIRKLTR